MRRIPSLKQLCVASSSLLFAAFGGLTHGELMPLPNGELLPVEVSHGSVTTIEDWTATGAAADLTTFVAADRKRHVALANGAALTQSFTLTATRKNTDGSERVPRAGYFGLIALDVHGTTSTGTGDVTLTLRDTATTNVLLVDNWTTETPAITSPWSIHSFSSERDVGRGSVHLIDGVDSKEWMSAAAALPAEQFIVVDLGSDQTFSGVHLTPRQHWTAGIITDYEIRVSSDPTDFSATPVSSGTLWNPSKRTVRRIEFAAPATGRYVRVSNTDDLEEDNMVYAAIGEFELANEPPMTVERKWLYLPNGVIDGLDLTEVELEIKVNSATPVALGRVELVRLHDNPGTLLFGKSNGVSGPDLLAPGAYGFKAITEHHHRSISVTEVATGGPAETGGLQVGDVLIEIGGVPFADNSVNPGWDWFDHSVEQRLGRAVEAAYAPGTPAGDLGKVTLSVLRPGETAATTHTITVQLLFNGGVAEMVPASSDANFTALYTDVINHVASAQESSGKWPGNQMRTWPAALALLGTNDPAHADAIYSAANYLFRTYPFAGESYDFFFYHGMRAMFALEYYRASGDERARRWLEDMLEWAPTVTHVSSHGQLTLGHGATGLPYGNKSLMAAQSHLLAAEGLCIAAGIDGNLFETCTPYILDCWSDTATGGHGGMGYNYSYRDLGEFWSRSGLTAVALHHRNERLAMRDALLRIMADRHPWMRNSHAYGEPGAALGLLAFASAQPAEFERLFAAWRANYLLHWEPGYGLHFTMPHMGAPHMEGDLLVNANYGMLWSYAHGGLHVTGGNPGKWLSLPTDPSRELEVIVNKSASGLVTLTCATAGASIYVTTDGTQPTLGALRYRLPFAAKAGMKIRARAYDESAEAWGPERELDCDALTTDIAVMSATGFVDTSVANNRASRAFDGKDGVSWMTNNSEGQLDYPHEVVLDLSQAETLSALRLTFDRDDSAPNQIHAFTSADGTTWAPDTTPDQAWTLASYADEVTLNWPSSINTRYLKLRFPNSFGGLDSYLNLRELRFLGLAPSISIDPVSGLVTITKPIPTGELRYTRDGSLPSATSPLYTGGFTIGADGGLVQARLFEGGQAVGALAIASASGNNNRTSYTATASSQQGGVASSAVDGDPSTIWHSQWNLVHPHHITLDLGATKEFHGFYYLPRSGGGNGTIDEFEVYVSDDGENYGTPIMTGSYTALGYPRNGDLRTVRFDAPVNARYLRVRSLSGQDGHTFFSVSELGIVEQPFHPLSEQNALSLRYADWLQIFAADTEDGDEIEAMIEYFLGTDPSVSESVSPISSFLVPVMGDDDHTRNHFAFRMQRDTRAIATGQGMVSTDLDDWRTVAEAEAEGLIVKMTETHDADGIVMSTYRAVADSSQIERLFFTVETTVDN